VNVCLGARDTLRKTSPGAYRGWRPAGSFRGCQGDASLPLLEEAEAPGLPDLAAVRAVCSAVSKPVNFMAGIKGKSFTVAGLEAAGVRRISLASSLYRIAMTGLVEAAREIKDKGTFGYIDRSIPTPDLTAFMQG
jgi:hypothetical protein